MNEEQLLEWIRTCLMGHLPKGWMHILKEMRITRLDNGSKGLWVNWVDVKIPESKEHDNDK